MNWYKKSQFKKELTLMRGLQGSGKSFLAKKLAGPSGTIIGADNFFEDKEGNYNFDIKQIAEAHAWARSEVLKAIKEGVSPIIWDNTNVTMDELKFTLPAIKLAEQNGYEVRIEQPDTSWAFNVDELTKRNTHGVPREEIEKKINEWVPDVSVEDIKRHYKEHGPGLYG